MRGHRGGAIVEFFSRLIEGDAVALGIVAFFAILALLAGLWILKVRRELQKDDEAHAKRYGRKPKK